MYPKERLAVRLSELRAEREALHMRWRLVSALEVALQIPQGNHLVYVLGSGHEASNRDALFTWVGRELAGTEWEPSARVVSELVERLGKCLTRWDVDGRHT